MTAPFSIPKLFSIETDGFGEVIPEGFFGMPAQLLSRKSPIKVLPLQSKIVCID